MSAGSACVPFGWGDLCPPSPDLWVSGTEYLKPRNHSGRSQLRALRASWTTTRNPAPRHLDGAGTSTTGPRHGSHRRPPRFPDRGAKVTGDGQQRRVGHESERTESTFHAFIAALPESTNAASYGPRIADRHLRRRWRTRGSADEVGPEASSFHAQGAVLGRTPHRRGQPARVHGSAARVSPSVSSTSVRANSSSSSSRRTVSSIAASARGSVSDRWRSFGTTDAPNSRHPIPAFGYSRSQLSRAR